MATVNSTTECLGILLPVKNVPADVETADTQLGKVGGTLESHISNYMYRGVNPDGRALVCEVVEGLTSIKRKTKVEPAPTKADANATRTVFDESEMAYFKRALAESGKTVAEVQAAINALPDEDEKDAEGKVVTNGKVLDFNAPKRVAGPKTPNKTDTEFSTKILALPEDQIGKAVAALKAANPGLEIEEVDGKPTVESLAWAIKANRDRATREAASILPGVA